MTKSTINDGYKGGGVLKEWAGWAVLLEWGGSCWVFLLVKEKGVDVFSVGVIDRDYSIQKPPFLLETLWFLD